MFDRKRTAGCFNGGTYMFRPGIFFPLMFKDAESDRSIMESKRHADFFRVRLRWSQCFGVNMVPASVANHVAKCQAILKCNFFHVKMLFTAVSLIFSVVTIDGNCVGPRMESARFELNLAIQATNYHITHAGRVGR